MNRPEVKFINSRVACSVSRSLLSLFLVLGAGLLLTANAQTTEEICRETKKVRDQLMSEREEMVDLRMRRSFEQPLRGNLSLLRKAIANGTLVPVNVLIDASQILHLKMPKESARMTPEERRAFQRVARTAAEKELQEITAVSKDELEQRIARHQEQIDIREKRLRDLRCSDILKQPKSQVSLSGTWTALSYVYEITQTGTTFKWKIINDPAYNEEAKGELKGKVIKAEWTNRNGKDSAEGEVTEVDSDGRATRITWKNGVVFSRRN